MDNLLSMTQILEQNIAELENALKGEDIEIEKIELDNDDLDLSFSIEMRPIEDLIYKKYQTKEKFCNDVLKKVYSIDDSNYKEENFKTIIHSKLFEKIEKIYDRLYEIFLRSNQLYQNMMEYTKGRFAESKKSDLELWNFLSNVELYSEICYKAHTFKNFLISTYNTEQLIFFLQARNELHKESLNRTNLENSTDSPLKKNVQFKQKTCMSIIDTICKQENSELSQFFKNSVKRFLRQKKIDFLDMDELLHVLITAHKHLVVESEGSDLDDESDENNKTIENNIQEKDKDSSKKRKHKSKEPPKKEILTDTSEEREESSSESAGKATPKKQKSTAEQEKDEEEQEENSGENDSAIEERINTMNELLRQTPSFHFTVDSFPDQSTQIEQPKIEEKIPETQPHQQDDSNSVKDTNFETPSKFKSSNPFLKGILTENPNVPFTPNNSLNISSNTLNNSSKTNIFPPFLQQQQPQQGKSPLDILGLISNTNKKVEALPKPNNEINRRNSKSAERPTDDRDLNQKSKPYTSNDSSNNSTQLDLTNILFNPFSATFSHPKQLHNSHFDHLETSSIHFSPNNNFNDSTLDTSKLNQQEGESQNDTIVDMEDEKADKTVTNASPPNTNKKPESFFHDLNSFLELAKKSKSPEKEAPKDQNHTNQKALSSPGNKDLDQIFEKLNLSGQKSENSPPKPTKEKDSPIKQNIIESIPTVQRNKDDSSDEILDSDEDMVKGGRQVLDEDEETFQRILKKEMDRESSPKRRNKKKKNARTPKQESKPNTPKKNANPSINNFQIYKQFSLDLHSLIDSKSLNPAHQDMCSELVSLEMSLRINEKIKEYIHSLLSLISLNSGSPVLPLVSPIVSQYLSKSLKYNILNIISNHLSQSSDSSASHSDVGVDNTNQFAEYLLTSLQKQYPLQKFDSFVNYLSLFCISLRELHCVKFVNFYDSIFRYIFQRTNEKINFSPYSRLFSLEFI